MYGPQEKWYVHPMKDKRKKYMYMYIYRYIEASYFLYLNIE